jgi:hypothetical protein
MNFRWRVKAGREASGARHGETAMNNVEILDPVRTTTSVGYKVDVSRGERNGRVSSPIMNSL